MYYPISLNNFLKVLAICILAAISELATALPEDVDQPIHITGDNAQIDETSGQIQYRGNVQLIQGTLKVEADSLTIDVKNEKVVKITARGSSRSGPSHYEQKLKQNESKVLANADTIVYHTKDDFIELIGNAHLSQNNNKFSGDTINYDIEAGKVKASSTTNAPVKMILESANRKD